MKIRMSLTDLIVLILVVSGVIWLSYGGGWEWLQTMRTDHASATPTASPSNGSTPQMPAAGYTPTPGSAGGAQMATAVAVIQPTPYAQWVQTDPEGLAAALSSKATTLPINIKLLAYRSGPGFGLYCRPFNVKGIAIDQTNVFAGVWTEWYGGITEADFQGAEFVIQDADPIGTFVDAVNPYIEYRKRARITITFYRWGVIGPVTRDQNERVTTVKDVSLLLRGAYLVNELFTGTNIPAAENDRTTEMALDLARWDSLLQLWQSADLDTTAIQELRKTVETNLNAAYPVPIGPGQSTSSDMETLHTQLLKAAEPLATAHGYAEIENLTVRIDPYATVYALETVDSGNPVPLVPADIRTRFRESLCPDKPSLLFLNQLKNQLAPGWIPTP